MFESTSRVIFLGKFTKEQTCSYATKSLKNLEHQQKMQLTYAAF
jgi:hypothetical protein